MPSIVRDWKSATQWALPNLIQADIQLEFYLDDYRAHGGEHAETQKLLPQRQSDRRLYHLPEMAVTAVQNNYCVTFSLCRNLRHILNTYKAVDDVIKSLEMGVADTLHEG